MATNRFQFSDDIVLKNGKVGINSADPQATLDVRGTIKADNLTVSGVATFTAYEGFLRTDYNIDESISITDGSALSGEIIVGTGVTVTNNATDYAGQGQIESLKVYNTFTPPVGGTEERPTKAKPGQLYYNQDFKTIEFFDGNVWRQVDNTTRSGRGVFGGGEPGSFSTIDYVNIASVGNALNFGNLTSVRSGTAGCASNIRGLTGGGYAPSSTNIIEYITIASEGNGIDFGDLTVARGDTSSCSSSTRGIWGGGYFSSPTVTFTNLIDYIQISTIGNALDFGDLSVGRYYLGATSSPTRGVFVGGGSPTTTPTNQSLIDFITISSTGNAVSFGNLTERRGGSSGTVSNSVRGVFAGGVNSPSYFNTIDYITTASTGNAQDFGDLTSAKSSVSGVSNSVRGVFGGGVNVFPARTNFIDYITIMSTGNAQDFGDLTNNRSYMAAMSDSHGGLGGF